MTARAGGGADERLHVAAVGVALAFALTGGFLLAVALPLEAALVGTTGDRWAAYAQVHGHLQAVGFVGLFIVATAYRLLPDFSGRPRIGHPRLVSPSLWLIAGGVLARAIGQPAAGQPPFAALMAAGAWAELLGAACFALNVAALSWPAAREGRPFAPFFLAGAGWFVLQAALGAVWLTALASEGGSVLAAARSGTLVWLQLFGFHLMFILGVALRSFPIFFAARRPVLGEVLLPWVLIQAGVAAVTAGGLARELDARYHWLLEDAGLLLAGAGLLRATFLTGWWTLPSRIRPASRPFAYTLQPAMAWLGIASLMLTGVALRGLVQGTPPAPAALDATRHVVGIGVVLMTIVGMTQVVLPEFATERLAGRRGASRGIAFAAALSLATFARAAPRLLAAQLPSALVYWPMALAGLTAMAVLAVLAFHYARAARGYRRSVTVPATPLVRPEPPRRDW